MSTLSITDARANLPRLVDLVVDGHEITITRHGQPVATLVRPDLLRVRRDDIIDRSAKLGSLLIEAGDEPLEDEEGLSVERAEELAAGVRADRDAD